MGQKASKLSKEDINNLRQETSFTARELQQWYKGFLRDAPTGRISKEDFIQMHKQFYPFGEPTGYATCAFEAMDPDNLGYITFKSFIESLNVSSRGTLSEKLKMSFRLYDRDNDGYVTYQDILYVVEAIYRMLGVESVQYKDGEDTPELRAERIWAQFSKDVNHRDTQRIDMKEFVECKRPAETVKALKIYDNLI